MNETLLSAARVMILLLVANGAPILLRRMLYERGAWPVDGGRLLAWDRQRWLGRSKTWRGLAAAILTTGLAAALLGLPWATGFRVGVWAMAGDLLSSFIKRRLKLAPGSMALGLDQIPESLFPLLAVGGELKLGAAAIGWLVLGFIGLELALSRILYAAHIRERPY
jgi:hypothetical protein